MRKGLFRWSFHLLLFGATFFSASFLHGTAYALTIMTILLGHELGHYFMCRKYRVEATFPLFIPMFNLLGTLGAVIAMKSPIPSRKALFDIGVAGPLVGLSIAIPAVIVGLQMSSIQPIPENVPLIYFGEPILFKWISTQILGPIPQGFDVFLHPIAFAGWAAMFVTAINLFPVGQLDGGHLVYAIFGRSARKVGWLTALALGYLGFQYDTMWLFFLALVLFFVMRHPAPIDDVTPLDARRRWIGAGTFALMILCFTPVPFDIREAPPAPAERETIFTRAERPLDFVSPWFI